ncbi:OPT oligopeptide transporter protein-domain-containing protein [Thelonectria olida]|uniref:OPT oligopeptide transporter protein-domain-containing protein n=1 Tax=Thelonectria olida TaxID=1576542 RepID=A0A9P8WD03_9HYPO|nr:OPT oligopeptide transporter protein-domain-containing protein [Thelonectria olida]
MGRHTTSSGTNEGTNTSARGRSIHRRPSASSSLLDRVVDAAVDADAPVDDSHVQLHHAVPLQPLASQSTSTSNSSSTARSTASVSVSHAWASIPPNPSLGQGHVLPYQDPDSGDPDLISAVASHAAALTSSLALALDHHATPSSSAVQPLTTTHGPTPKPENEAAAEPSIATKLSLDDGQAIDASLPAAPSTPPPKGVPDMASKTTPFLRSPASRPEYGTVSLTPSRNNSPAGSDCRGPNSHQLRHVSETMRSGVSRRSTVSKHSSKLSEDVNGAVLVPGLESRLGLSEPTHASGVFEESVKDDVSENEPFLDDDHDDVSTTGPEVEAVENSPHEAVRASVPPTDDLTLSINTPRMWCLSVLFAILGSSTNLFFSLRYPSVAITPVIALLLGKYDPEETFVDGVRTPSIFKDASIPSKYGKLASWRLWLAQGRWNEKEHTCVYVSSNVAFGFAFATDVIVEQTRFYNQDAPIMYQLLLTISTQILGYGFAGLTRRFLVRPSGMIWPGTLMSAAMFSTLHKQENKPAGGWTISRWKFFYIVFTVSFLFYFLPGLLMPALSYFNAITWFAPKSVVIANLFGVSSGLGLFPLTFDWAQITYVGSPLLVPFWAAMNVIGGLAVVMWIIAPILYYTNVLFASYMPILSAAVFDNTGSVYNVSRILTSDFLFDREAYQSYSRVFLPITYVLSYGVQFAGLAALLTHTACWHGKDIWRTWKKALAEAREDGSGQPAYQPVSGGSGAPPSRQSTDDDYARMSSSTPNVEGLISHEDIHSRLMKRYEDAPLSWYLITFVSMTAIGIFVVEYYPVHLPWYGLLLALAIGALFFIPNGIIMAVTNQHSSIYLICQLICGVVFPGRPIANMVFVTYGYISSAQGIKFAADLKLGHYMKIPPRILFAVQIVATLVSSLTQIGVLNWMFVNVKGLCTSEAVNGFTCPIARVHFNGSILWGVVGPHEFFGPKAIYRSLVWFFPLGAFLPIPLWLHSRRHHSSILRKVNLPVIFGAMSWIPPATGLNFSVWVLVCYVFNYLIKNRHSAWWSKYTMTLSAALDSGLAFGIVVVFFGFIYPGWMEGFKWWGTEVYKQGCDWQACAYNTVSEGEHFGPDKW